MPGLLGPRVRQTSNAYVLSFPKGLGGLAVNVFHLAPDHNNWAPSESNSAVKKGFQGSGFDLGLNFGVDLEREVREFLAEVEQRMEPA